MSDVVDKLVEVLEKNYGEDIIFRRNFDLFQIRLKSDVILEVKFSNEIFKIKYLKEFDKKNKGHVEFLRNLLGIVRGLGEKFKVVNPNLFLSRIFRKNIADDESSIDRINREEQTVCKESMYFFYKVLDEESEFFRKGILIFFNSKFIGVLKGGDRIYHLGNRLMVCLDGKIFKKFGVVDLNVRQVEVGAKGLIYGKGGKDWVRVNLVGKKVPIRFREYGENMFLFNSVLLRRSLNIGEVEKELSLKEARKVFYDLCEKLILKEKDFKGEFDLEVEV